MHFYPKMEIDESSPDGILDDNIEDNVPDARSFFGKSKTPVGEGIIHGSVDSFEYSMDFPKRGKCLIFNHKKFESCTGLNERNGTDADAARLFCRFNQLQFDVEMFKDLKKSEIRKELKKVGKSNHSDYSCFVCCILTHGDLGILYAADGKYETDEVFAPFRGNECPTLAGKPKMFFIQACQGDKLDDGVIVTSQEYTDGDDENVYKIPTHADFLIACSTVPGFYSWRNTTNGSWFIQALCAVLQKYAKDLDILRLLTVVNRRVAYDYQSYTPHDSSMHLKKQVPCITSTLTREVRFPVN